MDTEKNSMNKNPAAVALGSIRSQRKAASSRKNGSIQRPHIQKAAHFVKNYPHHLVNNEWQVKFPVGMTETGRVATYNPDYYCPKTNHFIEVTTSKPNISEQGWKWRKVIQNGIKLKIFWWEGKEITEQFRKKGGRPKNTLIKKRKLTDSQRKIIRETIDSNRLIGGSAWKDFTRDEIMEIYGHLPLWIEENKKTS